MIKAKLLNSDAILNNFTEIEAVTYVPGENVDVVIRLFASQRPHRFVPPNGAAIVKFKFQTNNIITPILEKTATAVDALDRSMWTISLSQAESQTLIGSNIEVEVDLLGDGTQICKAVIGNAEGTIKILK